MKDGKLYLELMLSSSRPILIPTSNEYSGDNNVVPILILILVVSADLCELEGCDGVQRGAEDCEHRHDEYPVPLDDGPHEPGEVAEA